MFQTSFIKVSKHTHDKKKTQQGQEKKRKQYRNVTSGLEGQISADFFNSFI